VLLEFRHVSSGDLPALMQLAADEPNAPHWTTDLYGEIVEQSRAKRALIECAMFEGEMVGFYVARQRFEADWELESIVVAQQYRKQGIGRQLMQHLFSQLREFAATRLVLEVRASNFPARRLYTQLGFREDGVRRNYYSHPQENAVLLSCTLTDTC
jgi:[ribosomal protein S18]-alanine N-acetyltransferase